MCICTQYSWLRAIKIGGSARSVAPSSAGKPKAKAKAKGGAKKKAKKATV